MRRLFLLLAIAGCNQVFGNDPTRLHDAEPTNATDAPPPPMVVQAIATEVKQAKMNATAFADAVTAGNAVVVCVYTESAVVTTVVDSLGSSFAMVYGPEPLPVFKANMYIYAAFGVAGGNDTVTVTVNPSGGNSPSIEVYLHELANVVAIDGAAGANGTSQALDAASSGDVTTQHANELLFGFAVANGQMAAGTSFTTFSAFDNNLTEGLVVTAPGPYAAIGTSTGDWAMVGAAFVGR